MGTLHSESAQVLLIPLADRLVLSYYSSSSAIMDSAKLAKMQASVRIGGKGTPRRKVKKVHKSSGTDDKKLQTTLKKLHVQPIQAIEEVNMFKSDGNVIHFGTKGPRIRPSKHVRHLRQRRREGAHRARARHPQPARPRFARQSAQARRELPGHAEGKG